MKTLPLGFVIALVSSGATDPSEVSARTPAMFNASFAANQLVFDSDRVGNHEIFVMNTDGTRIQRLTRDPRFENWWPRISPDRTKVLFYRSLRGEPENYAEASLWQMNADGRGVVQLRAKGQDGWIMQGHGEWSPNGTHIAMFGSAGAALEIFVTAASGRNPVQYTRRGGVNTDVSWSPDGSKLLFNGCPTSGAEVLYRRATLPPCTPANYEIYVMPATPFAAATRLTTNALADYDPYFSPDGSKIAWLVNVDPGKFPIGGGVSLGAWAIRMADADGSHAAYLMNDGNINSKPSWSLDGQWIFFHRMELDPLVEGRFGVFRIERNGSGLTRLTQIGTGTNEHPSN